MIRRPPRSTLDRSSAASDVYKRQALIIALGMLVDNAIVVTDGILVRMQKGEPAATAALSLIHISEPTRPY